MEEIVEEIIKAGNGLSPRDPLGKVYVHSALEFQRVYKLLKARGEVYDGVCLLGPEHMSVLSRYLERLKKIRSYYYEVSEGKELPEILRPPIVEEGKLIKIKKEVKPPFEGSKEKVIIHLTFTDCRAKHLEEDGRTVIIVTDILPQS